MRLIIDIPDEIYDDIKHGYVCSEYADTLIQLIPNSKPYEERPQGEWIENSDKLGLSYMCPFCGHEITGIPQDLNYCCKCGADMRGKK